MRRFIRHSRVKRESSDPTTPAVALRAAPKALRGDLRTFSHRVELLEGNVGIELAITSKGSKTAIAPRDDALAADNIGKAANALGDELGMFDIIRGGVEHAGDQDFVVGQFYLLPHGPFVGVARVGRL